jgi:hypothetical protein
MVNDWEMLIEGPGLECVRVGDVDLKPGDRVRIHPMGYVDMVESDFAGKTAVIESIEHDLEDGVYLAVAMEDEPGKVPGMRRRPPHRFFLGVEEVEFLSRP